MLIMVFLEIGIVFVFSVFILVSLVFSLEYIFHDEK